MATLALHIPATQAPPAKERRLERRYLLLLALVLLGYSAAGRGFAYLGAPPLYIGEAVLLAGLLLLVRAKSWDTLVRVPSLVLLLPLLAWGLYRTLPFISSCGFDAVRDLAVFGYSAYAIIAAMLVLDEPRRLQTLLKYYRRYVFLLLLVIPVVAVIFRVYGSTLPRWPGTDVGAVHQKEGDMLVQLAGVLAFWSVGLAGRIRWVWIVLLTVCTAFFGSIERAGLVAFGLVMMVCFTAWPKARIGARVLVVGAACIVFLAVSGLRVEVPGGKGREISFDQVVANFKSILGDSGSEGMDSTKEWRLDWWSDIVGYTINGPWFWKGKGFGVNLADDDGYQVLNDGSLRSPHNVHMNVLARSGAPGFLLWVTLQSAWAYALARTWLLAMRRGHREAGALLLFLGCFWLAAIINASFDVFLEGPMGAIWFWTVYGVGAAAVVLYRRDPQLLVGSGLPDQITA